MRISINLASRPFVELRPLYAKLRLGMAALALIAVGMGVAIHRFDKRVSTSEVRMRELKTRTSVLTNERLANETKMRQGTNQAILERSQFLNQMFARKSFSWTAVMMDLEQVLPAGVQVTSIEPVIMAEGQVNIRMRVSGQRENAVDLLRNLEHSKRFIAPRLVNESAQSQEGGRLLSAAQKSAPGGVEFDILSGYNPLPAVSKKPEQKVEEAGTGSAKAPTNALPAVVQKKTPKKNTAHVARDLANPASARNGGSR